MGHRVWFPHTSHFSRDVRARKISINTHRIIWLSALTQWFHAHGIEFNSLMYLKKKKSLRWWVGVSDRAGVFTCLCLWLCNDVPPLFIIYSWSLLRACLPQIPTWKHLVNGIWTSKQWVLSRWRSGGKSLGKPSSFSQYHSLILPKFSPLPESELCLSLALSCLLWFKVPREKQEERKKKKKRPLELVLSRR